MPADTHSTPTQDERTLAMLAHLLQVFFGILGPLIIYVAKKDQSRFVAFHALQALFWQIAVFVISGLCAGIFFVVFFGGIAATAVSAAVDPRAAPIGIVGVFAAFPILWLVVMTLALTNLVLGILYAIKANNGEWAVYPLIGRWAERAVGN